MTPNPVYTRANCHSAYQLNWSLSIFGKSELPSPQLLIEPLRSEIAKDNLRILDWIHRSPNVAMFFLSSQPQTAPSEIIRSVKGRWQYLSRANDRIDFRRNYRITSVGTSNNEVLDNYIAKQPAKHRMADSNLQARIENLQFHDPDVDLSAVRRSSYGEFLYSLQIVIEFDAGWMETRSAVLVAIRHMIIGACRKHDWMLSRIGLLSDHIHVLLGAGVTESPDEVAMILMNNIAWSQGMKPILRYSFYVGTFGPYDRGAIWNRIGAEESNVASARTSRTESLEEGD